jgi:hypothetical protein
MMRTLGIRTSGVVRGAATACCLGASLALAACSTPLPSDYPTFNLTNTPDTDRSGDRP